MTAAERLAQLAGTTGTAAALLLAIGVGATTGEALANYSQLPSGTAAEHLFADVSKQHPGGKGPWWDKYPLEQDPDEALIQQVQEKWEAIAAAKSKPQVNDAVAHTKPAKATKRTSASRTEVIVDADDAEMLEAAAMFLMMIDD